MSRFVVVATTLRGVVDPPEPLDARGQDMAAKQLERDRALECDRVVWAKPVRRAIVRASWSEQAESTGRVTRLMRLAERTRSVA